MAGELNGTNVLVKKNGSTIVGQGAFTMTFGGTPIDISNKSNGDWVTYLDGELAAKQYVFSGELVFNNDTVLREVLADSASGTQDTYTIEFTGSGATTDESFTGLFVPTAESRTIPHGEAVKVSLSFNSSGPVTRVPAV